MADSESIKKDYSLVCEIDATHSGTLINNRIYPPDGMSKGVRSWTSPYKKPVLTNHDETQDPVGRVIRAKYHKTDRAMSDGYKPILRQSDGYGFLRLTVKITDSAAIQKVLDGRYETVSVRMITDHAFCSICNCDWSDDDGPCEHMPGSNYEGKLAYITTGDLSYREMSFVNMPADEYAGVKESLLAEDSEREPSLISVYANNSEDGVLSDLSVKHGANLYDLLEDTDEEGDDVVLHLLDRSNKVKESQKEEEVKPEDLKKDQLCDLEPVKELIQEAIDTKVKEKDKDCEDTIKKLTEDCAENNVPKADYEKVKKELEDLKESKGIPNESDSSDEKDSKISELEEDLGKSEEGRKKVLDDNVNLNSEMHAMIAERLFDLKKELSKPDVADLKTPEDRSEKIEEFAQRSVESLKDQIEDLKLEKEKNKNIASTPDGAIDNPGAVHADNTNEVDEGKDSKPQTKQDRLKKLFS